MIYNDKFLQISFANFMTEDISLPTHVRTHAHTHTHTHNSALLKNHSQKPMVRKHF